MRNSLRRSGSGRACRDSSSRRQSKAAKEALKIEEGFQGQVEKLTRENQELRYALMSSSIRGVSALQL